MGGQYLKIVNCLYQPDFNIIKGDITRVKGTVWFNIQRNRNLHMREGEYKSISSLLVKQKIKFTYEALVIAF